MALLNKKLPLSTYHAINDLQKRITELEAHVFKTARKSSTTRAQQILLMQQLGLMDKLSELNISNKKKAKLLSILLNSSQANIEDDLSEIHRRSSSLKTVSNYEFILSTFQDVGLKSLAENVDFELDKLKAKKDK